MKSGLFGKEIDLCLNERIGYIDNKGILCIGAALFIRGDALEQYLQETGAAIVSVKEEV